MGRGWACQHAKKKYVSCDDLRRFGCDPSLHSCFAGEKKYEKIDHMSIIRVAISLQNPADHAH